VRQGLITPKLSRNEILPRLTSESVLRCARLHQLCSEKKQAAQLQWFAHEFHMLK
ncbi:MAG: hypothetical protein ACI91J_001318, partial [Yoonia sp.]